MNHKELLPHFTESEIKKATASLYKYSDNRACSNNRIFRKAIKATYSGDYSNMSLKRTFLKECKIQNSNFSRAAVTGSKFIQTIFEDCIISGTSFQCCDFIDSKLQKFSSKIEASNFSDSTFINTEFENINFCNNTIFQSLFENCIFTSCVIGTTTLEGSIFRNCIFTHVDLSNLNIDYVTLHNPIMNDVYLPFFQIPYIINGFLYLNTTDDDVWIDSEKSPCGKIEIEEYLQHTKELIIYFYGLKEFFPLANIYLAKNDPKTALACIMEGIERTSKENDFRMIKHFCRLVTSTSQFTTKDMKEVYHLLENRFNPDSLTVRELHNYLLNIGEIRAILFHGNYGLQTLEIIIQTNIEPDESKRLGAFLEQLNKLLDEYNVNGRSQFVELRHNSDYNIFISIVDAFTQLMPIVASLYAAFGIVDKVAKFNNTLLDNKIKRETIRSQKNLPQKDDIQIKLLEEIRELKSDKRKLVKENRQTVTMLSELAQGNKILSTSVLELTHYIKGMTNQNIDAGLLYSKTIFGNKNQDEN